MFLLSGGFSALFVTAVASCIAVAGFSLSSQSPINHQTMLRISIAEKCRTANHGVSVVEEVLIWRLKKKKNLIAYFDGPFWKFLFYWLNVILLRSIICLSVEWFAFSCFLFYSIGLHFYRFSCLQTTGRAALSGYLCLLQIRGLNNCRPGQSGPRLRPSPRCGATALLNPPKPT